MNKIKVELSLVCDFNNEEYEFSVYQNNQGTVDPKDYEKKYIKAELFIDGRKIGGYFDYTSLLVDGYDNRGWYEKEEGRITPEFGSAFYPLSCSCGEPGCNGIGEGVSTKYNKEKMIWNITDKTTRDHFGSDRLEFDREEYDLVIRKIWRYLHNVAFESPDLSLETELTVSEYLFNQKLNNAPFYIEIY